MPDRVVIGRNRFRPMILLAVGLIVLLLPTPVQLVNGKTDKASPANFQSTPSASAQVTSSTPAPTSGATATPGVITTSTPSIFTLLQSNLDKILVAIVTSILTVIGTLFVVYFQKVLSASQSALGWIWKRLKLERAIEARYRATLARELRSIQILQMTQAKNLETIFIPLKLGEWIPPDLKETEQTLGKNTLSFSEALDQFQRITIVGDPGSGKTTITSQAAAAVADRNFKISGKDYFPLYIHLRHLKEFLEGETYAAKSLKDLLCEILDRSGFSDSHKFVERKMSEGVCLIVLDGFDELADKGGILQQRLSQKVDAFVGGLPTSNRVVLTSRAAGYEPGWFPGFRVLEMTNFSLLQITSFVSGWFGKELEPHAKSLQHVLEESDRLQFLVSNPLMLAIVCFVYQTKNAEDKFLPDRRVDLYDRCIEALIVKWDVSRGINRQPSFTLSEIEAVLRYIAYEALILEKIDFSRQDLLAFIRTHLPKAKDRRQYEDEVFLQEALQHTGLFKEKARDVIGFLHLTFQEYLAAQVMAEKVVQGIERKDVRFEIAEIVRNLANPRWAEPITLTAGILRGRNEFVTMLFEEYKARSTTEIRLLLAGCLRDADLAEFRFDASYLEIQDEILSDLVGIALTPEP